MIQIGKTLKLNSLTNVNFKADLHHRVEAADKELAMQAMQVLSKHYPGHLWAVHVNSEDQGGVMVIKNYRVSFMYGYILYLSTVYADPKLKCVIKAGGEILERANMKRGLSERENATVVDGVKSHHQPFNGIIT